VVVLLHQKHRFTPTTFATRWYKLVWGKKIHGKKLAGQNLCTVKHGLPRSGTFKTNIGTFLCTIYRVKHSKTGPFLCKEKAKFMSCV
jgi:hypothetical protein